MKVELALWKIPKSLKLKSAIHKCCVYQATVQLFIKPEVNLIRLESLIIFKFNYRSTPQNNGCTFKLQDLFNWPLASPYYKLFFSYKYFVGGGLLRIWSLTQHYWLVVQQRNAIKMNSFQLVECLKRFWLILYRTRSTSKTSWAFTWHAWITIK